MVAFDEKLKGFAHLHPNENTTPITNDASHTGALTFTFVPPSKGAVSIVGTMQTCSKQE